MMDVTIEETCHIDRTSPLNLQADSSGEFLTNTNEYCILSVNMRLRLT